MKILIFGAGGFLGQKLMSDFSKENEVVGYDKNGNATHEIDALNEDKVNEEILRERPDLIVDCIALRNSLDCERDPGLAKKLNFETANNILFAARKVNSTMIFISSSYVFNGAKEDYSEEDETCPLNVYGKTKVMAEKEVLSYEKGIVVRVDLLYGYNGEGLNNGHIGRILGSRRIEIGDPEQMRSPLFVDDLGGIFVKLSREGKKGIFNIAGPTKINIYNFFEEVGRGLKKSSGVIVVDKRKDINIPNNSTLSISKINDLGIKTSSVEEAIEEINRQINSGV